MLPTSGRDKSSLPKFQNSLMPLCSKYFERKPFFGSKDRERKLAKKASQMGENSVKTPLVRGNFPTNKSKDSKNSHCQSPIKKNFNKNFHKKDSKSIKNHKTPIFNGKYEKNILKNINKKPIEYPMENSKENKDNAVLLKNLFSNRNRKEQPLLYKLAGTDTRSIKAVHEALISYFKLPKEKIGGISLFEGVNYWVFLAYPSNIREIEESLNCNSFNVHIAGWTQREAEGLKTRLAIYANNISKNKKEFNFARQATKRLIHELEQNTSLSLNEVIYITQNLNKINLNYSVFNLIKNNIKTENFPVEKNLLKNESNKVPLDGKVKRRRSILIIPEELWDEGNQEARDLFIEQNRKKIPKTPEEPALGANVKQESLPRRHDPGGTC